MILSRWEPHTLIAINAKGYSGAYNRDSLAGAFGLKIWVSRARSLNLKGLLEALSAQSRRDVGMYSFGGSGLLNELCILWVLPPYSNSL